MEEVAKLHGVESERFKESQGRLELIAGLLRLEMASVVEDGKVRGKDRAV